MTAWLVFLGGGLGALARWALSDAVQSLLSKTPFSKFPLGILTCNLLGCFLIGCLFGYFSSRLAPTWAFPLLATGFLGGFTTFSTFARDSHALWVEGLGLLAIAKVTLSVVLGIIAVIIGVRLTIST